MGPGGFPGLQNRCDPTTSGRVGSIPTRSRHRGLRTAFGAAAIAASGFLAALVPANLPAQVADSARVGATRPRAAAAADSAPVPPRPLGPPISPGHALLESLIVPGWGQASLHRSTAGALFAAMEIGSAAMLLQSKHELAQAQAAGREFGTDTTGNALAGRIKPRKAAVEDWAALLIFTHLISAADAFVAAQLWDVPVEVGVGSNGRGAVVAAHARW